MDPNSRYLHSGQPVLTNVTALEPVRGGREKVTFKYYDGSTTHYKICRQGIWHVGDQCFTQENHYSDGDILYYVYRGPTVALVKE